VVYHTMDEALIQIGLPVKCIYADCQAKGFVKPKTDYDGWYKAKLYRRKRKRWFCPEHKLEGVDLDKKFYEDYKTPEPEVKENTEAELYKLLED